jgi:hypothetical protein
VHRISKLPSNVFKTKRRLWNLRAAPSTHACALPVSVFSPAEKKKGLLGDNRTYLQEALFTLWFPIIMRGHSSLKVQISAGRRHLLYERDHTNNINFLTKYVLTNSHFSRAGAKGVGPTPCCRSKPSIIF